MSCKGGRRIRPSSTRPKGWSRPRSGNSSGKRSRLDKSRWLMANGRWREGIRPGAYLAFARSGSSPSAIRYQLFWFLAPDAETAEDRPRSRGNAVRITKRGDRSDRGGAGGVGAGAVEPVGTVGRGAVRRDSGHGDRHGRLTRL